MTDTEELSRAIKEFETALPDWWWSVGHCSFSRDASCGPDRNGCDAYLLKLKETAIFDDGFHADLLDGALSDALMDVLKQAISAKKEWSTKL